ncbi:MAG: ABC transporter permease, partial [Oscillospiraceae bacterium]|nr:ABC transporter permease [Oscillospiraceae bacterium]
LLAFLEEHDALPEPEDDDGITKYIVTQNTNYEQMWDADGNVPLRIVGIFRGNEERMMSVTNDGVLYSDALLNFVIENSHASEVVTAIKDENVQVSFTDRRFMMMDFISPDAETQSDMLLQAFGGSSTPVGVTIYPRSFEQKDALLEYLDAWNDSSVWNLDTHSFETREQEDKVFYTDMAGGLLSFMSEITNAIAIVLIAFASISLIVSLIMISIITYISVLERTKEIGILRALGARKKDVTRVFNAETFIIGVCSGIIGIVIAWGLTFPANIVIEELTNLPDVAQLNILHVAGLLILSTTLTVLGGSLPAKMASKKDAVEALRSE